MFINIGSKIKGLAKIITWVGVIGSFLIGLTFMALFYSNGTLELLAGFAIVLIGSLLAWVSSFILYGFGELVENSDRIAESCEQIAQNSWEGVEPEDAPAIAQSVSRRRFQ